MLISRISLCAKNMETTPLQNVDINRRHVQRKENVADKADWVTMTMWPVQKHTQHYKKHAKQEVTKI